MRGGEARDLADATVSAGEAWYRLQDRFFARTTMDAKTIASDLQYIRRPTDLSDSFNILTDIRGLVR